jgi:hypothetical protein
LGIFGTLAESRLALVGQEEFRELIRGVFAHSPAGSGDIADRVFFTRDGVLGIAADSTGKIGFGVASALTPTHSLLSAVDDLNRRMDFGHYWLAPGADENNYSLVCGFKFQYETVSTEHVVEIAVALMRYHGAVIDAARQTLGSAEHEPYWRDDVGVDAQALVLTSHLG